MNTTLDYSAAFMAAISTDPIALFLQNGGDWFEADQMVYRSRLEETRAKIASTDPSDAYRRTELLRTEADALVNLGQMSADEFKRLYPSVAVTAPLTDDESGASTISVISVPSVCSTRTSKSYRSFPHRSYGEPRRSYGEPRRSSYRPAHAGAGRASAPQYKSTPARPTRPAPVEAPKKPVFGTQSRFAALLDSDSE